MDALESLTKRKTLFFPVLSGKLWFFEGFPPEYCCGGWCTLEWLHRISLGLDGTNEGADATSKQSKPRRQKVKSCKTDRDRLQSNFGIKQLNFQKNSKLWCHLFKSFFLSNLLGLIIRLSWTSFYMSLESLEPGNRTTNSSRSTTTPNSATSVFRQLVGKATTRPQGLRGLVRRHRHRQAATSVSVEVEGEEWSLSWN